MSSATVVIILDLLGTAVFALSGASAAIGKKLDLFGVCVLGLVAATGGGALRDVLLGATPPVVLADWRYLVAPVATAILVFYFHPHLAKLRRLVLVSDAVGLGMFVVAGTTKALDLGLEAPGACVVGMITGIGGGLLRDMLLGDIPVVLQREIYALAALAGAIVVAVASPFALHSVAVTVAGIAVVTGLRVIALRRQWSAPTPRGVDPDGTSSPR